jgi:hypothetical protein
MRMDRARGTQVGDDNTQTNHFVPPQRAARRRGQGSPTVRVNAGNGAVVNTSQKTTNVRFSVPVVGPLLSLVAVHPVIAAAVAVVVVGGGGVAASGVLSGPGSGPDGSAATHIVRGFKMATSVDGGEPVGYDFSGATPTVADPNTDAIYVSGGQLTSTSGQLALWSGSTLPTAGECREEVAKSAVRQMSIWPGLLVCYVDKNNNPGYITETAIGGTSITVDTAHLR